MLISSAKLHLPNVVYLRMDQLAAAKPALTKYMRHTSKVVNYLNGEAEANIKVYEYGKATDDLKDAYKAWIDRDTLDMVNPSIIDQKICIGEMDKYYKSNSMITGLQTSGRENRILWGPTEDGNYVQRFISQLSKCAEKRGFNGIRNNVLLYKVVATEGNEFFLSDTLVWVETEDLVGSKRSRIAFVQDASTQTDLTACSTELEHLRHMDDAQSSPDPPRSHDRKGRRKQYQSSSQRHEPET